MLPGAALVPAGAGGSAAGGSFLTALAFLVANHFLAGQTSTVHHHSCAAEPVYAEAASVLLCRAELLECQLSARTAKAAAREPLAANVSAVLLAEFRLGQLHVAIRYREAWDLALGGLGGFAVSLLPWSIALLGHVCLALGCAAQNVSKGCKGCWKCACERRQEVTFIKTRPSGARPTRGRSLSPRIREVNWTAY
jgi:hypothetical protein